MPEPTWLEMLVTLASVVIVLGVPWAVKWNGRLNNILTGMEAIQLRLKRVEEQDIPPKWFLREVDGMKKQIERLENSRSK